MTPSLTPDPSSPGTEGEEMRYPDRPLTYWLRLASDGVSLLSSAYSARRYCAQAADQIEALEAENARLHSDLTAAREERDTLRERVARLEKFVAYVLLWRDRGPPHGDPVTAWSVISNHPVVGYYARSVSSSDPEKQNG
ncbi:DUF6212 domain-containing protein [Methylobacterium sp. E-005]|uniref:DUF6212 domain-containing protein n=1 Tax=Methylobacterium sp. E-005 TaxID=2836549 RepID=UPI001FB9EC56|nr:DUF6212 domain-containing protein [Methylobacterium sp. E-005]